MAVSITLQNENGAIYLYAGMIGHPLGQSLAEARQALRDETSANPAHDRRAVLRAVVKRLQASGLDPATATLAQIKTAVESSAVDV